MLSPTIKQLLDHQIVLENQASFNYLSMAIWAELAGYDGAADFFYRQSHEEKQHMLKLIRYLTELDQQPSIPIHQPTSTNYTHLKEPFEHALRNEIDVTNAIHQKVQASWQAKDITTFTFLQWFVNEQREEERTMRDILNLFENIKPDGLALYTIDQALYQYPKTTQKKAT